MRRSRAALAAVLMILMLAAVSVGTAVAANPNSNAAAKARAEHARVIAYWTAERIANAKPRDFVRTAAGTFKPAAKPDNPGSKPGGGGGGGGGTTTVVKGASWTGGGPVVDRTGKVLFTMGGGNYVCSASGVADSRNGFSLILTAAHCAYDEVANAFATNWIYVPSFDTAPTFTCAQSAYGCWTTAGGGLVVHSGYTTAGGFNTQATIHDFAIAFVGPGGKNGTTLLESLGTYGISYPAISTGGSVHAFGYPAAGKYKGRDLTYCAGPTFNDQYNEGKTWGIACNMTGGSSGGPWLADFTQSGGGTLTSLNSYGYSGLSNMYGPKFNLATKAVFDTANASATNGNAIAP
ncbi:peptidase [soil metagenome]